MAAIEKGVRVAGGSGRIVVKEQECCASLGLDSLVRSNVLGDHPEK